MERNEEKIRKKKIDIIVKVEKEKWSLLKKNQEEKKNRKNDKTKYDKYIIQEPNQIRIIVLGESCSGKTSLIQRFINDKFNPEYKTTTSIGAFKSELLFLNDQSFRVELIDTPPLENFYKCLEDILYFVQGVIFVFDASNKNSFLRMQDYFKITNFYEFQKIGIVATKKDICTENNKYKFYQLKKFCELNNAIPYFLSSKNNKEEVTEFINLICPEIIPSLVNKKEIVNLQYPYTKSIKNNIPKRNYIDEEIIKKAKEEDSSYDSEESKNIIKKDKEQEIKEFYLKKKNVVVKKEERPKINYIYNIGNNSKQYKEDKQNINNLEEKKEELESFNNVIGNINIDLEHLFNKYRPESGSIKNDKKYKNNRYKNKNKNKTLEDGGEWVNVNIDNLVEEFLKTKTELKKDKKEKKLDDKKSKKSSKKSSNNKVSIEKEKSKKESLDEEKKENDEDEKEDNDKENKKESEEENEEENEEEKDNKDEQEMNDEFYENLYGDIYDFQQSLKNEVMREQENNNNDE